MITDQFRQHRRKKKGDLEFLVVWKGWPDQTWETEETLRVSGGEILREVEKASVMRKLNKKPREWEQDMKNLMKKLLKCKVLDRIAAIAPSTDKVEQSQLQIIKLFAFPKQKWL